MAAADLSVSFPSRGVIRLKSRALFGNAEHPDCRRFLERVFEAAAVTGVTIRGGDAPHADLRFRPEIERLDRVVERVADALRRGSSRAQDPRPTAIVAVADRKGAVRSFRRDPAASGWEIRLDRPGRLRLKHRALTFKRPLRRAIERELAGVLGIDGCRARALAGTVEVDYDSEQLGTIQVIEILDSAVARARRADRLDERDGHLPLCTASLPIAAAAQFAAPALVPVAVGVVAYTAIPTFREAYRLLVRERRLGVDVLDSIVVIGCLGTLAIFPGAILCWCLGVGRDLVRRSQDRSKTLLLGAFGKRPRHAWLDRDGAEVRVPVDDLRAGDLVVVGAGEVVPADGHVVEGLALIDQHALTGEPSPAEKGVGDRVFAATIVVAGQVFVSVEGAGGETAAARIGRILDDAAGYKLSVQRSVERLADRAVLPTLGLGAVGLAAIGPAGAVALLKADLGAGLRMAAPLAVLSSLALCAHKGILVRDARGLERMSDVDTVLFDRAGILARERPEVGRILAADGFTAERILRLAAAAERRFHHPIALAIRRRSRELGMDLPAAADICLRVGQGVAACVDAHTVRVGSLRFLEAHGIAIPPEVADAVEQARREGCAMVLVGVDDHLAGAVELLAALPTELRDVVEGLRRRGVRRLALVSGDEEDRAGVLAESLGMDVSYTAHRPAEKAHLVETLRQEGRKVCFVGDGIADMIAMEKADVSISLRGPSALDGDSAQVVLLANGLEKLCELRDAARELDRNVTRSWSMILAPNVACIAGVFTMGFGIVAAVVINQVAALAAMGSGMLPLRKVAQLEAERRYRRELGQSVAAGRADAELERTADEPP